MYKLVLSESARVGRLHRLGILDTEGDEYLRAFAQQALDLIPGTSIAAVSLVDSGRQWFKTIIGLDTKETSRDVSFCSHTIQGDGVMVVEDATRDPRFAKNSLVTSGPGIRFYAGAKLVDGVGALCVMGLQPRRMTESEKVELQRLARFADLELLAHGTLHQLHQPRHAS